MHRVQHPDYPLTVYYAFKQTVQVGGYQHALDEHMVASTGWETMLEGLLGARFTITGTWPVRTEGAGRVRAHDSNALASSIVLVCRQRPVDASVGTRREFLQELAANLPSAVRSLQQGNIAPVDLAQAAIGPGMAIFSRYSRVLEIDGSPMRIRTALGLINQTLDLVLAEQDGDYDAETRWTLAWYEGFGFASAAYGEAETLSKAKNVTIQGLEDAGSCRQPAGRCGCCGAMNWNVTGIPSGARPNLWLATQHLARALAEGGEQAAADLLTHLDGSAELAKELAYRLHVLCERNGWTEDAVAYNALVMAWPDVSAARRPWPSPTMLFPA